MKRTLLSLLTLLVALAGTAQTIGEAFYVYRSDGEFNAFLREEVDSIAYSYYDADSLYYGEIVTQIVYTADSTYWIPLASIDSVSFLTPETKYTPQVVKLEPLLPYIVSVDGMKLTFSSNMPSNLFPRTEDILVLDNFDHEQFPTGFAGRMSSKEGLQITCDSVCFEDIYEQIICYGYYTAIDDSSTTENSRLRLAVRRKIEGSISNSISVSGTLGSKETGIFASLNGRLGMDLRFTFKYRKGEPTYFDISLTPELTFNFEAGAEGTLSLTIPPKDPDAPLLMLPLPNIPFYFKLTGTPVLEAYLKASIVVKTEAKLGEKLGIKYVNGEFRNNCGKTSRWFSRPDVTGSLEGNIFVGLKDRFGIFSYGDVVSAVIEKKAGVEFDGSITENIKDPDSFSYDELKDNYLDVNLKASAALKAEAKLFSWFKLSAKYDIFSAKFNVFKFHLVPSFTKPNVAFLCSSTSDKTATISVIPDGNLLIPVQIGLGLWDEDSTLLNVQFCEDSYIMRNFWSLNEYQTVFPNLSLNKDYTVRPLVKLLGGTIVARPEETFKISITPVTLTVSDVTATSATAHGRIDGHEYLDKTMKFGFSYEELGSPGTTTFDATEINADGTFSFDFMALKPNTDYRFFAFVEIDDEVYIGLKRLFKTDVHREPYYVWDDKNKKTYYYDDMRISRHGVLIDEGRTHYVAMVEGAGLYSYFSSPIEVEFDTSFSKYHPKYFSFKYCDKLERIENLNYLNTDKITNMNGMFQECVSLTSLDLSNFNTANVTDMTNMFLDCPSLTGLELYTFDTSKVRDMESMFGSCTSLTGLDLSNFNTSNVTNMCYMFGGCNSLKYLDVSNFNTENVTNMSGMFIDCHSLMSLNLRSFNTTNVTDMSWMFCSCSSLTSLDLSNFNTPKIKKMSHMFQDCNSVTYLDLSNFHVNQSTMDTFEFGSQGYNSYIFENCSSLHTIYAKDWNIKLDRWTFSRCSNLSGGMGTRIGDNFYGFDKNGEPLYYYCSDGGEAARVDGGKDRPGLFTGR